MAKPKASTPKADKKPQEQPEDNQLKIQEIKLTSTSSKDYISKDTKMEIRLDLPGEVKAMRLYSNYLAMQLDEVDTLIQIAEEASELSQAALKLARIIRAKNPTPLTEPEARLDLEEEYGDLKNALAVHGLQKKITSQRLSQIRQDKMKRWYDRVWAQKHGIGALADEAIDETVTD